MLYLGTFAVMCAVFMIWREYSAFLDGELKWCREMIRAIGDLGERMRCYLSSPREWAQRYESELLAGCGFLDRLKGGESLEDAFVHSEGGMELTGEVRDAVYGCFSGFGGGYLDGELESLGLALEKLRAAEQGLAGELPRRRKAVGAILGACALGIVILIM